MLINLRNALMAGKRLPYDAEVEYLESSGTQYIDVDASKVATASRYVCYGQYMVNANQAMMWSHGYRGIRSYGSYIGFVTGKYATTNTTVIYGTGCIIDFDAVSLKGILTSPSGTELANVTIGSSSASGGLRIFAASETATGYLASQSRIYFMRVYDAAGNILFDAIPVRKGTVGYLYDRVSGKLFGNAGTGDFVLGPDVVQVEWLEFTGTQRLLTDITPSIYSRDLKTSITYQLTSTASRQLSGSGSSYFEFCSNGALVQVDASYPADLNRHTLDFIGWVENINLRVYYDGQSISAAGFVRSDNTSNRFTLGSLRSDSQSNPLKAKLSSLSMEYQDATKFLHWLPVRVGTEGAMMDVLTRRIYRNAGTGAFTYGNDLPYPIPAE